MRSSSPKTPIRSRLFLRLSASDILTAVPQVIFTSALERHLSCPPQEVAGSTVREVLNQAFAVNPAIRGYVLDDQGALRKHMTVFVDGEAVRDRDGLSDGVKPDSQVYVMQALSGG